ncbi:MAG: hypothetical protein M0C28_35425 [Candidatus Moduliflexus flocculans]|nr:hypothetical protein [Candidatus Moduliflexus flocculans]
MPKGGTMRRKHSFPKNPTQPSAPRRGIPVCAGHLQPHDELSRRRPGVRPR